MLAVAIVIAAVLVAAVSFFFLYGRAETWTLIAGDPDLGHFDRAAPVRSPTPNDALFCTAGLCAEVAVDKVLPDFAEPPARLIERIDAAMRAVDPNARRVDDGGDPARARYVTRTPFMRFPDTNSFEAVALEGGRTGLVAHARAQLGRSDLGNNRKRLEAVLEKLADR